MEFMRPWWPVSIVLCRVPSMSYCLTVRSGKATSHNDSSVGENATSDTAQSQWFLSEHASLLRVAICWPRTSYNCTVRSQSPPLVAKYLPFGENATWYTHPFSGL